MQEQYIDELVFKCLTLECDLGSAVNRLITQPGQFAGKLKSFVWFMTVRYIYRICDSSNVQHNISQVHSAVNTRIEISYLQATTYYFVYLINIIQSKLS